MHRGTDKTSQKDTLQSLGSNPLERRKMTGNLTEENEITLPDLLFLHALWHATMETFIDGGDKLINLPLLPITFMSFLGPIYPTYTIHFLS